MADSKLYLDINILATDILSLNLWKSTSRLGLAKNGQVEMFLMIIAKIKG